MEVWVLGVGINSGIFVVVTFFEGGGRGLGTGKSFKKYRFENYVAGRHFKGRFLGKQELEELL